MSFYFNFENWYLLKGYANDNSYCYPECDKIPMMQARRMSISTKLASEVFMQLSDETDIDSAVFVSTHGELERSYGIIKSIISKEDVSPALFSMSVHNAAAGMSTIMSKKKVEATSISLPPESYLDILFELETFFLNGHKSVLLLFFDGEIPDFYHEYGVNSAPAFALGFVVTKNKGWCINRQHISQQNLNCNHNVFDLLNALESGQAVFYLQGKNKEEWLWSKDE